MSSSIRIIAPSHVHIGNFDLTGDLGRVFGTLGVALERPRLVVEIAKASDITVDAPEEIYRERALLYAKLALKVLGLTNVGVRIKIIETIPVHVGLGSQTALALSIGFGIAKLYDVDVEIPDLAVKLGRGSVSGLGIYSFMYGGFIVDGGVRAIGAGPPPLIFRHEIPSDWYFIIAIPWRPLSKILQIKMREDEILRSLEPMPSELSGKLSRIVLSKIIPSLIERNIREFGQGITMFNRLAGEYWSSRQGGSIYCDSIVEEGINLMLRLGCYGACQSCWGPTFYGLVQGEAKAREIVEHVKSFIDEAGGGIVLYTQANNEGAKLMVT